MIRPTEPQNESRPAVHDLEQQLARLREELGKANKVIEEKSRELEEITASLQARLHERTCDLEAANEKLRRFDELHSAFWAIE
jgi:nitrate/nitrite-specific signal transduction histidine kinase